MWIKICGTTNLEDARLAAHAGASALGFVFAPSPRRVTPEQVAAITARLPRTIEKYGVFVDASFEEIVSTVKATGLTGVQLHSTSEPALPLRLREHFAEIPAHPRLGILQVLHFATAASLEAELEALRHDHAVDAVLIDSRTAVSAGGTGIPFDWSAAQAIFRKTAPHLRLVAAGGLSPGNVAEAIRTLQPWGVDVVTGVESSPGRKDPARVQAFIAAARSAFSALAEHRQSEMIP
jgi:phosphoribosylanthranilate isomerase